MMPSRQQSPGPSDEVTTLRPTTPMSHAGSDFSRTTLMETAFRPQSPLYGIPQYRSAQSAASPNTRPGSSGADQYDTTKFWKPFTIRLPYLIFLNILTLSFIIAIETLYYFSNHNGGLLFMKDIDDLPLIKFFAVQYLPTLFAVLYGICWSIVDLDSKRLEPFYDLSKPGGAKADALFLEYQYQFALFVPFRALFKRHWAVFLSSTVFLTATLVVTPLQSSLLTTIDKISVFETDFNVTSRFLPLNGSDSALTPEFLFTEYTITRLNGSLPGFTAAGDSFLPMKPSDASFSGNNFAASNWSVAGTSYSLAVQCVKPDFVNITSAPSPDPEELFPVIEYSIYHPFKDGACNITSLLFVVPREETISYNYEWRRPDFGQWCGFKNTTTLATVAYRDRTNGAFGIQTVLCELKGVQEYKQDILVNATTHTILERKSARRTGRFFDREDIDLIPFDAALFNKPSQEVLASDRAVFADARIDVPGTLFNTSRPLSTLTDISALKDATEAVYRYFFSLAVSTSPAYLTSSDEKIFGKIITQGQTIVVDRTFATLSDVLLGIVLFLGIVLAAYSYQRDSALKSDPDSLSATMALILDSSLPSKFRGLEMASTKLLKSEIKGAEVMLGLWTDASGKVVHKLDHINTAPPGPPNQTLPRTSIKEEPTPLHLRLTVGVSFLLAHLAIIAFLAFLFIRNKESGLPVLTNDSFAFNLIWAFIPTLVATLLEPMWASINRDISVLQPFYNLIKRNVPAKKSLSLKYQTIPVLLVARSFIARDFLLSLVSFMTALVSLLAVTLPGIFLVDTRAVGENLEFKPQAASPMIPTGFWLWNTSRFGSETFDRFLDPFAAARANISEGVPLPAWSTREYVFLPVRPAQVSMGDWEFYRVPTIGFRGGMECRPIIDGVNGERIAFHPSNGTTTASFSIPNKYRGKPSELIPCGTVFGYRPPAITKNSPDIYNISFGRWPFPSINNTAELFEDNTEDNIPRYSGDVKKRRVNFKRETAAEADERREIEELCRHIQPVSWSQRSYRRTSNKYIMDGLPKETLLVCEPKVTVANFSVEVDRSGNIRSQRQVGASLNFSDYLENGFTETDFLFKIMQIFEISSVGSFRTKDWPGLLMTRLAKDTVNYNNHTELGKLVDETSALSFSIFVGQNLEEFFVDRDPAVNFMVNGKGFRYQKRVIMSGPLTIISLTILGLFCFTLSLVYGFRRRKYLPRQPTSLASIIAYCQESSLLDEISGTWALSTSQRQRHLENLGYRYGFGWYRGRDGLKRLGVDKEPLLSDYVP
ncbi:hypothetical protein TWF281_011301 [Arthrobotrys megalospora]